MSPIHKKDHRFLVKKRRGQPQNFWSLASTKDGTLTQDLWKNYYAEHEVTGETYNYKEEKRKEMLTVVAHFD